jgi:hypothetical protein
MFALNAVVYVVRTGSFRFQFIFSDVLGSTSETPSPQNEQSLAFGAKATIVLIKILYVICSGF